MKTLIERLEHYDVDQSLLVLGRGCGKTKKTNGQRDRYYLHISKGIDDAHFAIQYCKDINQYIAWRIISRPKRTRFSVVAEDVPVVKGKQVIAIEKGLEFVGRDSELVYTFNKKGIDTFIEEYLIGDT